MHPPKFRQLGENPTALEYTFKRWKVNRYNQDKLLLFFIDEDVQQMQMQDLVASIAEDKETEKEGLDQSLF